LLFWSGAARIAAVRNKDLHIGDIALGQSNWPPKATQLNNAFGNQLELPVLFYVLVILAIFTGKASLVFVVLAWVFVATRLGHAAVHVTHNNVLRRFWWYTVGAVALLLLWLLFAAQILLGL
ncbi:MAG: MAPEG family protein, partial [Bauldia sp.]